MTTRTFRVKTKNLPDLNLFNADKVRHVLLETTEGLLYMFHGECDGTNSGDMSIVGDPDVTFCFCCYPALTNHTAVWSKIPDEFKKCKTPLIATWFCKHSG